MQTSRPPTQPGGCFFGFAARGAILLVRLSTRRSLVRPRLPANRTEQPIAARSVFEVERNNTHGWGSRRSPQLTATAARAYRSLGHVGVLLQTMRGEGRRR